VDIKIIKAGPWRVWGNLKNFKEGQVLTVGEDVPNNIAEDMLRCGYAEKINEMPKIETKKEVKEPTTLSVHTDTEPAKLTDEQPQKKNLKKDKKKKKKHRS
jgi:phage terminase Nu1 subunit (DNA packaging protein)